MSENFCPMILDQALRETGRSAGFGRTPETNGRYKLVVIAAANGAGLVGPAAGAAGACGRRRVALIEARLAGRAGTCLNVGCVPSKAVLRLARAAAEKAPTGGSVESTWTGQVRVGISPKSEAHEGVWAVRNWAPTDSRGRDFRKALGRGRVYWGPAEITRPGFRRGCRGKSLRFATRGSSAAAVGPARANRGEGPPPRRASWTNETGSSTYFLPRRLAVARAGRTPPDANWPGLFARLGGRS